MELQNMGLKLQNFGMQMKNMMFNVGNEMQNMGIQISNIGMQIFNMGVQMQNQNINMENNIKQNPFMGMPMNQNMNMINQMEPFEINNINNNDNKLPKINFTFSHLNGLRINIPLEDDKTVEELLKLYTNKKGIEYNAVKNDELRFYYNGENIKKYNKLKDLLKVKNYGTIVVSVVENC